MDKEDYEKVINELINVEPNKIKKNTVIINNDKPFFNKKDFDTIEGKPQYFELDKNGRSNGAIALISKNTIPLLTKKKLKYPEPSNWNKAFENRKLFEKCHIIAYSLSAKLANSNNIFIGTVKLNKSYMKKIENEIKKYIKGKSVRILYKVTVKYKDTSKIPIGVLIEAQSIDGNYSVCRFCYNVQRGKKFRYSDGMLIGEKTIWSKVVQTVKNKIIRKNNRIGEKIMYILNEIAYAENFNNKDLKIVAIKIVSELCMLVTFSNGEKRIFDAKYLMGYPAYKKLEDFDIFKKAYLENGIIVWENGSIDIAPDTVYKNSYEYEQEAI